MPTSQTYGPGCGPMRAAPRVAALLVAAACKEQTTREQDRIERRCHEEIIEATQHWLTRAVIGLNLCPFAKSVHVKNQIRYVVSEARTIEDVLADLSKRN